MKIWMALLVAGLAYGGTAAAEAPDYGYLELGLGHQNGNDLSGGYSGQVQMSVPVTEESFLYGRIGSRNYGRYSYSNRREDIIQDYWQLGGGVHLPLSSRGEAVLRAGYLYADTQEGSFRGADRSAPSAGLGVRWIVIPDFEVSLFYDRDTGAFDPQGLAQTFGGLRAGVWQNVYSLGLRWQLYTHTAFGATLERSDFKGESRSLLTFAYCF